MRKANFSRIIQDLVDGGMTQLEIARAVRVDPSVISRLKRERDPNPNYSLGNDLIRLHDRMKEQA